MKHIHRESTLKLTFQTTRLAGHTISYMIPADPNEILEDALSGEAAGQSGWDPYWGLLWAASPMTAELLLRHAPPKGTRSLEVGCGVGLTGIAGLMAGLQVTFSDHSPSAVEMAQNNAALNGYKDVHGLTFDWSVPPEESPYDFIFGSDILYDAQAHQSLLRTLSTLLSPGGAVWIGDAGRSNAPAFVALARLNGWNVSVRDSDFRDIDAPEHLTYRLILLTRSAAASAA